MTEGVEVTGQGQAKVAAHPQNYFDDENLNLKKGDLDDAGARKRNKKATQPHEYIKSMQEDLVTLQYLTPSPDGDYGSRTEFSVKHFQRHAARLYRMAGSPTAPADVKAAEVFTGRTDGICDQPTAKEIQNWLKKTFVNPVGRFKKRQPNKDIIIGISTRHSLRADVATDWEAIVSSVGAVGGILTAEGNDYGDTVRAFQFKEGLNKKAGTSNFSFHYCARAIDIDQSFASRGNKTKKQRYFVQRDASITTDAYWIILCRTEKQDGSQGFEVKKSENVRYIPNMSETKKTSRVPDGFYIDMSKAIQSNGKFTRIHAQTGFDTNTDSSKRYDKTEWWHFQYTIDVQETFLDEVELIGRTETLARSRGWNTNTKLNHKPG